MLSLKQLCFFEIIILTPFLSAQGSQIWAQAKVQRGVLQPLLHLVDPHSATDMIDSIRQLLCDFRIQLNTENWTEKPRLKLNFIDPGFYN